jgi:PAS domain-containing protein
VSVSSPAPADNPRGPLPLDTFELLSTPIWVFDLGRRRIDWANAAAVKFWQASSREELLERDMAKDFSLASEGRLTAYAQRLQTEARITEQWTFYTATGPTTVLCSFTPVEPRGAGPAFLVEATPAAPDSAAGDTLRAVEAFRHTTALVSVIDL